MKVIGTAGHVDHGKSTLIAALTGKHPDRLKEEQLREMTIDLGFGWLTLPNGEEVGIVDVPGHRDFIENMLSGIGGIDAALLVIAADEGIMPQTKEHLAILDLLQIPSGLIVLTKTDLALDSEWLDLIEMDIRAAVAETVMEDAPIVRVSAKARMGLDSLVYDLQTVLEGKPTRADLNRPRLPIDRVFTMSGFGTVVTGTLSDGHLAIGDDVEILPGGLKGRIRGLQTHQKNEDLAIPGSRTAVNISGVGTEQVQRGDVVTHPNQYQPTRRIDAQFRLLKDASLSLKHGDEVKFFVAASETVAALRLLGTEELRPGEEGWIQLELREPIVTVRGDRYILRRPSPGETLGGGMVIDPQPKGRHKRFDEYVLNSLQSLAQGTPTDVLYEAALALSVSPIRDIITQSRLGSASAKIALNELMNSSKLIALEEGLATIHSDQLVIAGPQWNALLDRVVQNIDSHHKTHPLRRGMPREELKSRLKLQPRIFNAVIKKLTAEGALIDLSTFLAKPGHKITFDPGQQNKIQALMRRFEQSPFTPPSIKDCEAEVGQETLNALIELDELITLSTDVIFRKQEYDWMVLKVQDVLIKNGKITLAEVRDLFNTSRKYAQALLEHLDAIGITTRDGDFRKLSR